MNAPDCIVVGAGIHGLCTAFWLARAGRRVTLLEQYEPAHGRGSSHGGTRITRSSYDTPEFVRLATSAHRLGWPTLEAAMGQALRRPTPGVFFGPDEGLFAAYLRTTQGSGADIERIEAAAARRRFPLLRFADEDRVLVDHTAAVLLAATTMQALRDWLLAAGATFHWRTRALHVRAAGDLTIVATDHGDLAAHRVVVAAGPWGRGLPCADEPAAQTTVLRQHVGYFAVEAQPGACAPGNFPVWAHIGATAADFTYGLPDVDDSGLKAAAHRTEGAADDPDVDEESDPRPLLQLARERFAVPVRGLLRSERCLYTMVPDHRLEVARGRTVPGLVRITACSGHAFKFGPELGRRAAALAIDEAVNSDCFGIEPTGAARNNDMP